MKKNGNRNVEAYAVEERVFCVMKTGVPEPVYCC